MFRIIENQFRPDGIVNTLDEERQTRNSALSYFHERISKMYMTELYTSVAIAVYDENLAEIDRRIVDTMYQPPVVEEPTVPVVEEPIEAEPIEEPVEEIPVE